MASKNSNSTWEANEAATPKDQLANDEVALAKARCRHALLGVLEDMKKASEFTASLRQMSQNAKEAASSR